jgi:hypothetical protein
MADVGAQHPARLVPDSAKEKKKTIREMALGLIRAFSGEASPAI